MGKGEGEIGEGGKINNNKKNTLGKEQRKEELTMEGRDKKIKVTG